MKSASFFCLATLALLAPLAAAQSASSPGQTAGQSTRMVVTPEGAFLEDSTAPWLDPATGRAELTAPGVLWTHADGGLAWIARAVSIGNRASQVFAEYDLNNEAAALLSVYDSDPPTEIWNLPLTDNRNARVDSAAAENIHVAIDQIVIGGDVTTRQAVLRKFTSDSSTPDWTYTFTPIINAGSNVGISRDGQVIVAAIYNNNTGNVEIAVFSPASNTPLSYTIVPVPGSMRGYDLSADGSTLYFSAGVVAHIFDVALQMVVFTANIGASFDSHAISGDGSVFAYGNFGLMRVWEKTGPGAYANTYTRTFPGQNYVANIDISDDSSTVAYGFTFYDAYLRIRVEALDVGSQTITMTDDVTGSGSFQNIVSDVSISADGQHFVVGLWGDQGNLVEEIRMYHRSQNAPIATVNLAGSIFDTDMSADGQRCVGGSKAVHANVSGNGGRVTLLDRGGEDMILRGAPSINTTVTHEFHAAPGATAYLLTATGEQVPPFVYPALGTLYIRRNGIMLTNMGTVPGSGVITMNQSIPNNAGLIGTSLWFQGLTFTPRNLSSDWYKMTILP